MNYRKEKLEKRLRIAGILLIGGLLVELVTLHWSHPTAFLFFAGIGGLLIGLGIVMYLLALVSAEKAAE